MLRLLSAIVAISLLATFFPAGAAGAPSWNFASENAVGDQPRDLVIGNYGLGPGDDFVVANTENGQIEWKLSNGDGTFHDQDGCNTGPGFPAPGGPAAIAFATWNPGQLGGVIAAGGSTDPVLTSFSQGTVGNCGFEVPYPMLRPILATGFTGLSAGDLNGDGNYDAVASDFLTDLLYVAVTEEFGEYVGPLMVPVGDGPMDSTLADFNGDGHLDIAVANLTSGNVSVALSTGTGGFHPAVATPPFFDQSSSVAALHANGDQVLDIAVAEEGAVQVLLGKGDGTFLTPTEIDSGPGPAHISVGDVNGDGRDDVLAVYENSTETAQVLLGRGDGSFQPLTVTHPSISAPQAIATADFRGNGSHDLAVVNNGSPGSVAVLLGAPQVAIPGATVAFGAQRVGTASPVRTVTVDNTGSGRLHVSGVTLGGTNPGEFEIVGQSCTAGVAPGASCEVKVAFAPSSAGAKEASLAVADDAAGSPHTVELSGTGDVSVVDFNPAALAFGGHNVDTTSEGQTVVVRNTGGADLDVSSVALTGVDASQFRLDRQTCTENPIPPEGSCQVTVEFAPGSSGEKHAAVTLTDDAPSPGATQSVPLSGTGTEAGLAVSPPALEFGGEDIGQSLERVLTVTNSGDGPLEVGALSIGGVNARDFAVAGSSCGQGALAPAGSCSITVAFEPSADGTRGASLRIESNAGGGPVQVQLQGQALERRIVIAPGAVEFGPQRLGAGATETVTVANAADGTVHIAGIDLAGSGAPEFAIESQSCTGAPLAPGRTCQIEVDFDPGALGSAAAVLRIADDAVGGPHAIGLAGTGVQSAIALSPRSLSFGARPVGKASRARKLTVRNPGSAPLNIEGIQVSGGGRSFRAGLGTCARPVPVEGSCVLEVSFRPRAAGAVHAKLMLRDDAPGSASARLIGRGFPRRH